MKVAARLSPPLSMTRCSRWKLLEHASDRFEVIDASSRIGGCGQPRFRAHDASARARRRPSAGAGSSVREMSFVDDDEVVSVAHRVHRHLRPSVACPADRHTKATRQRRKLGVRLGIE